jgi:hypothetical protein
VIFKTYPGQTPPHGRIDGVIYFFGIKVPGMDLTCVAFEIATLELDYWDGTAWVNVPLPALTLPLLLGLITTPDVLADVMIGATAATQKPLVLQGAPSQTADLFQVQTDIGGFLLRLDASGVLHCAALDTSGTSLAARFVTNDIGSRFGSPTTDDVLADTLASTLDPTHKPFVVQAAAAQTANLQEWQDSTGAVLCLVDSLGVIYPSGYGGVVPPPAGLFSGVGALDGGGSLTFTPTVLPTGLGLSFYGGAGVGPLFWYIVGASVIVNSVAGAADSGVQVSYVGY